MKKKRPLYWNSFSIFPVSISTISRQSARHSAPVYRISSTWTDYGRKMTSCRFSKWRLSAILTFRGPIMGSLKSPCRPSYTSSRDTIALNCFFLRKSCFLCTHFWRLTTTSLIVCLYLAYSKVLNFLTLFEYAKSRGIQSATEKFPSLERREVVLHIVLTANPRMAGLCHADALVCLLPSTSNFRSCMPGHSI